MAIVLTKVAETPVEKTFAVTCLEADIAGLVAHGLIDTPQQLTFLAVNPVIAAAIAAAAVADKTNVYFFKANAVGSAGAAPGTTVVGYLTARLLPSQIASEIVGPPLL